MNLHNERANSCAVALTWLVKFRSSTFGSLLVVSEKKRHEALRLALTPKHLHASCTYLAKERQTVRGKFGIRGIFSKQRHFFLSPNETSLVLFEPYAWFDPKPHLTIQDTTIHRKAARASIESQVTNSLT